MLFFQVGFDCYWNICRMTKWGGLMSGWNGYLLGFPQSQAYYLQVHQVLICWQVLFSRLQWRKSLLTKVRQVMWTLILRTPQEDIYPSWLATLNSAMGRIPTTHVWTKTDISMPPEKHNPVRLVCFIFDSTGVDATSEGMGHLFLLFSPSSYSVLTVFWWGN